MALDTSSQLPAPGVWFRGILDELDGGANPRELATRVLQESTMLLPILVAHVSWELARSVVAGNPESARRYAELFLYLADLSFVRRAGPRAGDLITSTASPPSASVECSGAERGNEKDESRYPALYL
jgi:hypothetical protein